MHISDRGYKVAPANAYNAMTCIRHISNMHLWLTFVWRKQANNLKTKPVIYFQQEIK